MDPQAEREALKALIESDGWTLFCARVDQEWSPEAVCRQNDGLYQREDRERRDLEPERRALALTTRKIQALRRWPQERITQLHAQQTKSLNPFLGRRRA